MRSRHDGAHVTDQRGLVAQRPRRRRRQPRTLPLRGPAVMRRRRGVGRRRAMRERGQGRPLQRVSKRLLLGSAATDVRVLRVVARRPDLGPRLPRSRSRGLRGGEAPVHEDADETRAASVGRVVVPRGGPFLVPRPDLRDFYARGGDPPRAAAVVAPVGRGRADGFVLDGARRAVRHVFDVLRAFCRRGPRAGGLGAGLARSVARPRRVPVRARRRREKATASDLRDGVGLWRGPLPHDADGPSRRILQLRNGRRRPRAPPGLPDLVSIPRAPTDDALCGRGLCRVRRGHPGRAARLARVEPSKPRAPGGRVNKRRPRGVLGRPLPAPVLLL
mmetsp:Transcript_21827/g.67202  ORF Transcript_21827/g.67202 Transcript_21827/m.67202 type:complete len:332 (-) Transcript_21827:666-1661(-)